jgi:hypothetical protein
MNGKSNPVFILSVDGQTIEVYQKVTKIFG